MPDSNRSTIGNASLRRYVRWAGLVCALVLACGVIQHAIYYQKASRNAEYYSRDAKNVISVLCQKIVTKDCADRTREISDAAHQQQREEYDLYSQQAMALWTAIMGGMAVLGVFLTAIGVWFIKRTLDATLDAVEDTGNATDAMIRQTNLMEQNQRPWLMIDDFKFDGPKTVETAWWIDFSFSVRNIGNSPAKNVLIQSRWFRTEAEAYDAISSQIFPETTYFKRDVRRPIMMPNDTELSSGQAAYNSNPDGDLRNAGDISVMWIVVKIEYLSAANGVEHVTMEAFIPTPREWAGAKLSFILTAVSGETDKYGGAVDARRFDAIAVAT